MTRKFYSLLVLSLALAPLPGLYAQTGWENPVKVSLREGKPVIAGTVTVASPDVAAHMASFGFDLLWIEMEHSPITLETLRNMVLATRGLPGIPAARVPVNELWTAKRVLDTGALGVIFPMVNTVEEARQAVAACKYPPNGLRGSGPGLPSFRWPAPEGYTEFADKNVLVVILIEDARGVENVEKIAAVPGIDVLFIGASDLSFSLGLRGNQNHPKHKEAVARIVAAAKKNKVPLGWPSGNPEQMQQLVKDGFLFFQAPADLNFIAAGSAPLLKALGKAAVDPKTRPLY
jgi:2-keto-3-deoxy-L-rhamnonate aldolase RhmA